MSLDNITQSINLLSHMPGAFQRKLSFKWATLLVSSVVLLLVVLSATLFFMHRAQEDQRRLLQTDYQSRRAALSAYQQALIQRRGHYLGRLPEYFKLSHQGFYALLHELSRLDMKSAWLTNIVYDYGDGKIRFDGYGMHPEDIYGFVSDLDHMSALANKHFALFVIHNTENLTLQKSQSRAMKETVSLIHVNGRLVKKTEYGGMARFEPVKEARVENRKVLPINSFLLRVSIIN
jgi:hypothetical protein